MNSKDSLQRHCVAKAVRDYYLRRISRRKMLKICAQCGLGFSSLAFLHRAPRAFASSMQGETVAKTAGQESAGLSGTDQQHFLKEIGGSFAGSTLRIVGENTPPTRATIEIMKKEFIPLTGIDVVWDQLPLDRVLARVAADTANQTGFHDIFYLDQAWIGRFFNDMVDPRKLLADTNLAYPGYDFDDFLPPLVRHVASYRERLAGIPFDIPVWITIYRKDIFEEMGQPLPRTIPDYLSVIETITRERAPDVFGTLEGWKSGHYSLLQKMTTWLWGHGGSFFNAEEQSTINDPQAQEAMAYMLELGKNMPPEVTTWDWFGEAENFAKGRAAIYTGIGEFFPSYDDPTVSRIVGLAEAAPSPTALRLRRSDECGFDETPGMSHHGGSCLAISRYSKNIKAAWVFLQWATSSDVTTRASLLGGGASPIRKSNYEDPRIKAKSKVTVGTTRHFDVTLDAIMNHLGTEPHLPEWPSLAVDCFAVELGKLTTGQQGIKTTLDVMAAAADRIVRTSNRKQKSF